jgi:hypothetical protein
VTGPRIGSLFSGGGGLDRLLPSRHAMVDIRRWSAPSLEQALELARSELPREFRSWDEVPGWHGREVTA